MAVSGTVTATARYFDGRSARPLAVELRLVHTLEVVGSGLRRDWSLFELRAAPTAPGLTRVGPSGSPERVEFSDPDMAAALAGRCPDLDKDEAGGTGVTRLVLWSVAAGLAVLAVAIYGVPVAATRLAPLVPQSVETRFGEAVAPQVVDLLGSPPLCDEPAGRAVLDRLVAKMTQGADLPDAPRVEVRRHGTANALALPGGRVILLSDILDKARTPDEFAAIIGHELGHVAVRDPTRSVIAAGGTSFLLSLILGDLTGSTILIAVGQAAISAGYSREAESAADAYGVAMLRRAGGDPSALASILERIDDEPEDKGETFGFLRSHPYTKPRSAAIRAMSGNAEPGKAEAGSAATGRRILPEADWQALRGICGPKPPK